MKNVAFVLQIALLALQYRIIDASYGLAKFPVTHKKVRIYLGDDDDLLIPKDSKVQFVHPEVPDYEGEDFFFDEPRKNKHPKYISKDAQDQYFDPEFEYGRSQTVKWPEKEQNSPDDLRLRSRPIGPYFGSYLSGYAPSYARKSLGGGLSLLQPQEKPLLLNNYGRALNPVVAVANPWQQGVIVQQDNGIKPVKEEHPDDLKYDFRTKTHSLR